jgi:hypothetical protein
MDVLDLVILLIECVVVGFGMAVGDWLCKVIAVKLLNSGQASLHDVEDEPDEDEERKKKARRRPVKPALSVLP